MEFWYRRSLLAWILAPLSLITFVLYRLRRLAFQYGIARSTKLTVPVVVIGNITVGGTGKTPLVQWLAMHFSQAGIRPGVLCASYRASSKQASRVHASADPLVHGDEAVMLARSLSCPVWSGPNRLRTALAMSAAEPTVQVILCDDGLQHYALARDCEIAVIDAQRKLGNGLLLPAGPLREPRERLRQVDAVVIHGGGANGYDLGSASIFSMHLRGETFRSVTHPPEVCSAAALAGKRIAAIAGTGNPERFFEHLRQLGVQFTAHAFPDHHPFSAAELRAIDAEIVLMTEKDAIKCARLVDNRCWALPVEAVVDHALAVLVRDRVNPLITRATK
jgi:tetraacyldisaccharide 4'-kinase